MAEDIESYWEDIRFYPVDPIIQLRAEDMARKTIAEELGMDASLFVGFTFEKFLEVTSILREARKGLERRDEVQPLSTTRQRLREELGRDPSIQELGEAQEAVRARRPR